MASEMLHGIQTALPPRGVHAPWGASRSLYACRCPSCGDQQLESCGHRRRARVRPFPSGRSFPWAWRRRAVVAMADDGGSTGILRERGRRHSSGRYPQVPVRLWRPTPRTRLRARSSTGSRLRDNHTLGNLMLSALEDATGVVSRKPSSDLRAACSTRAGMCTPQRSTACHWSRADARWALYLRARRLPVIRVRRLRTCGLRGQGKMPAPIPAGARCHPQGRPDRARAGVACSRPSSRTCWSRASWMPSANRRGATLFVCCLGRHAGRDAGGLRPASMSRRCSRTACAGCLITCSCTVRCPFALDRFRPRAPSVRSPGLTSARADPRSLRARQVGQACASRVA